ncbi:glutamate/tyrosine decarboxylase-like PLP-dependent enzyme [Porphyrobacter sp. MBR-155]|jgi:glutamate/tyrosine decarboxylase-like PLP-dependent enzyme|uniref:pyridoxal phosphate-dependent decarboxylase family protein n=1 Tax=Porphyrobacter sp. MBR-155 TaxID=3156464 RepID=UPI003395F0AA
MRIEQELALLADADARAARYLAGVGTMRVFPDAAALAQLARFEESLPEAGADPVETIALLDDVGSPATAVSNGPRYFGFVIGAALPVASAAERLALAWDQCASSFDNAPVAATVEKIAARWVLDILDLPRDCAVGFGTSATACGIACLAAARRSLLLRVGWDVDVDGLAGAPTIRVVVPASTHVTVKKALRLLGFGLNNVEFVPVDAQGRMLVDSLPALDERTILCLQAGEVNTGEFDQFRPLIERAKAAKAWVHVDGAFGIWARASRTHRHLTDGVDGAHSWTTDGHKWLNTPYDGAMAICRNSDALAAAMNSDASYATASQDAQKNLTLEFSRRPRGLPIWAALRSLGRAGVEEMIDRHCAYAKQLAAGLREAGYEVCNRVVINQVLVRADSDAQTVAIREMAQSRGVIWFGPTVWQDRPAFRLSVSSWRTNEADIQIAIDELTKLKRDVGD